MTDSTYTLLDSRDVLVISGDDRVTFLQGLVSNDVTKVSEDRAAWTAFLTPQGKYLHDFFMISLNGALVLECEGARRDDLKTRLERYKLRAAVDVAPPETPMVVAALAGAKLDDILGKNSESGTAKPFAGGVVFLDPRLAEIGARAILPRDTAVAELETAGFSPAPLAVYDSRRVALGLPDGSRDLEIEKSGLLESGFDELNGVDWNKGCYLGQELTARTKYRGLVKRRLMPVTIDGPVPEPGTPILLDGANAGEMRSATSERGIALIRLDVLDKLAGGAELKAGSTRLTASKPDWAAF